MPEKRQTTERGAGDTAADTFARHWPEYLMEGTELGVFMISACVFASLTGFHGSPLYRAIASPSIRRLVMGVAMGLTAMAIIYSPIGRRTGAHFNPAVTLTFWRLGKINRPDALGYVIAQTAGGLAGVLACAAVIPRVLSDPAVNYVATVPGRHGVALAFAAEVVISFGIMITVLTAGNNHRLHKMTGVFVGMLLAAYIWLESPISGTSLNPARTLGSAVPAHYYRAIWVYFTAPLVGMLAAAEAYLHFGSTPVTSGKLMHDVRKKCLFNCDHPHDGQHERPPNNQEVSENA